MSERPAGTGQWRKLFFNKTYHDEYGVRWKLSTWKVLLWMIFITLILVVLYSFFAPNQKAYLSNALFLGIITMIIIMILWVASSLVWKSRKIIAGFIIALICLFAVYFITGAILSFVLGWQFHYGFSTWLVLTILAGMGTKNFDNKVDRRDVFFWMLVFVIFVFGNAPAFSSGGFLAEVDKFISIITDNIGKILHPAILQ